MVHGRPWGPCTNRVGFSGFHRAGEQTSQNIHTLATPACGSHSMMVQGALRSALLRHSPSERLRSIMQVRALAPRTCPLPSLTLRVPRNHVACREPAVDTLFARARCAAAASCATPPSTTRSGRTRQRQRQSDALPRQRQPLRAPRRRPAARCRSVGAVGCRCRSPEAPGRSARMVPV